MFYGPALVGVSENKHFKKVFILLLAGVFCLTSGCSWFTAVLSSVSLLSFCLIIWSLAEVGVMRSPHLNDGFTYFSFSSVSFYFMYFEIQLGGT